MPKNGKGSEKMQPIWELGLAGIQLWGQVFNSGGGGG